MVPVMAVCYFVMTVAIILIEYRSDYRRYSAAFSRKLSACGRRRQAVSALSLMNGVKRGLFSNEAGSGSAPCAAAAADSDHPAKIGLVQAFGVFIDTIVICSCTAMLMFLVAGGSHRGSAGNGSASDGYELSYGLVRRGLYRCDSGAVQLFHIHRNPVLCPVKCGLSLRR